jgi:ubiquinone/menaquinone biosynthesis C-methylase UbiE
VNDQEMAWWQEFSDVEEQFCWTQTPSIQRLVRGHYVRRIARGIPSNGTVLEFGCGSGWLALLLAENGARRVFGVDFSAAQIQVAKRRCAEQGLSKSATFHLIGGSLAELSGKVPGIDVLVIHGVLHHLTNREIRGVLDEFCRCLAAPRATVFVLEPVVYEDLPNTRLKRFVGWLIDRLIHLPLSGQSLGIRKCDAREVEVRERLSRRCIGVAPRGPSPKEHPFVPGELEMLLRPYLHVVESKAVLAFSFHAAKNMLLMRLSYPRLASWITWPYLLAVSYLERFLLSHYARCGCGGHSVFELKRCTVRLGAKI